MLAALKQEDVFKSISENVGGSSDPTALYAVLIGAAAFVGLLVFINSRWKREARPKTVNHQGRLLKELTRKLPLKKSEIRQLRVMAAEQGCDSPLTLILCPSLLAKGLAVKSKADRRIIMGIARKMGVVRKKSAA